MTAAKIGRSMKKRENMGWSPSLGQGLGRSRRGGCWVRGRCAPGGGAPRDLDSARRGAAWRRRRRSPGRPALSPLSTTHRFDAVERDPLAERRWGAPPRCPCRPCPCRRRTRTCPAGRPARPPAARRARCCAPRPAGCTRTNWPGLSRPSALATSARISNVPGRRIDARVGEIDLALAVEDRAVGQAYRHVERVVLGQREATLGHRLVELRAARSRRSRTASTSDRPARSS